MPTRSEAQTSSSAVSHAPERDSAEALSARGISKRYGGVHALDGADLEVRKAEIHAIIGENGAGKSTLAKIIAGLVQPDNGEISIDGRPHRLRVPQDARAAGIATVHQELSLIPQLSVGHNLILADPPRRRGLVSLSKAAKIAEAALARLGVEKIDPRLPAGRLPLDQQQMIEIAKAMMTEPKILILDEATSSLSDEEVGQLFTLVRSLNAGGTTVLMITHRMREVWALAHAMTVLRDGRTVGRFTLDEIDQERAVSLMAGRDVKTAFPSKAAVSGESNPVSLELHDVRLGRGEPWSLRLQRGEIFGVGGLQGQGQRELLRWLYGAGPGSGTVVHNGERVRIRTPSDALRHGIVLVPEDRAVEGVHLNLPVRWNLAMATLPRRSRFGVIDMAAERGFASQMIDRLAIKVGSPFDPVSSLSGGTQQKVAVGKFLGVAPSVLLFLDSTRGIDVKTKFEFYAMLRDLARSGATCLVYSSDTEELVGMCDRIAVFHDGAPGRLLEGDEVTQEAVVAASFAVVKEQS